MMSRKMKTVPALFAALTLSACGTAGPLPLPDTDSGPDPQEAVFETAVFYYDYSDAYVSSIRTELAQMLNEEEISFREYDGNSSQTTQTSQIEEAILNGADLLIINVVNAGSTYTADELALLAARAGVPAVFFNRCPEADGDEGLVLGYYDDIAFVGTDPKEAGHLQGEMIGNYLLQHYDSVDLNGDGVISYALFKGEAANTEAIYRTRYAVEDADAILTEAGYPALSYFDPSGVDKYQLDMTGRWSAAAAQSYMAANLTSMSPEKGNMIELIISNNDDMADGAIRALNTFGMNLGTEDSLTIPVFGVDATVTARQLIREGKMTGTVRQDPEELAASILRIVENVRDKKELLDGLDDLRRDEEHGLTNKVYLPYSLYTPDPEHSVSENTLPVS